MQHFYQRYKNFMQETLDFLRELQVNNNREWFQAHIETYRRVEKHWKAFVGELLAEIQQFDPAVADLTVNDCIYRIYRDVRFSADKSPYKTHFGTFIAPGGKKSMHSGYYFHISADSAFGVDGHFLCTGTYCYSTQVLNILREDLSDDWESFKREIVDVADPRFAPMMMDSLKRVPNGYDKDAPYADWLRMKMFGMSMSINDSFLFKPHLAQRVAALFKTTKPLNDFINRAIDYSIEEA